MTDESKLFRVGVGRRLDCMPWVYGVRRTGGLQPVVGQASTLGMLLRLGKLDAALLGPEALADMPEGSGILSAGCVACPDEAVTDRVLSRVPLGEVHRLAACGQKAATPSLVLRCLWGDMYGQVPEVRIGGCIADAPTDVDGVLWTGACGPTKPGYRYSVDLGRMWNEATGLPLVWRVWIARPGVDAAALTDRLIEARRGFAGVVGTIADDVARQSGWPADMIRRVLAELRSYELGEDERDAADELLFRGSEAGLIDAALAATAQRMP